MKVILYPRVSSKVQVDRDSIDAQISRMKQFCESKNYEIKDTYSEPGGSASIDDKEDLKMDIVGDTFVVKFNLKKRPSFKRLLEEARDGKFNAISFFKWDRYSRDVAFADLTYRYFKMYGIKLIPTDDSDEPLTSSIMQILSRQEIDKMKARVRSSRLERFSQGMMVARPPFGYRFNRKNKYIEIDKIKSQIVKDVFKKASEGIDYKIICKEHNLKPQQYYNILRNKVYYGIITFEGIEKKGNHDAIITEEIYNKANKII